MKYLIFIAYFCCCFSATFLAADPLAPSDMNPEIAEIEKTQITVPEKTIQFPEFKNGKFIGYSEIPFEADRPARSLASKVLEPDSDPKTIENILKSNDEIHLAPVEEKAINP